MPKCLQWRPKVFEGLSLNPAYLPMRSNVIFLVAIVSLVAALFLRSVVWESAAETPPKPSWYFPEPQLYEFAWGGKQKRDQAGQAELRSPQAPLSPDELARFASHPSVDKQTDKWNPPASEAELQSLREHLGALPQQLERLLRISNGFFESPEETDFGFFKRNSSGSFSTSLNVEKTWTTRKSWSLLTSEQMIELKTRLDLYLSKVDRLVDLSGKSGKGSSQTRDLKSDLIPIAYTPREGILLCLKPDTDLLFVLANNEYRVDVGGITFHPGVSDRIMIIPTNTRLQTVLDKGPCNDLDIVESDKEASDNYINSLRVSGTSVTSTVKIDLAPNSLGDKKAPSPIFQYVIVLGLIIAYSGWHYLRKTDAKKTDDEEKTN